MNILKFDDELGKWLGVSLTLHILAALVIVFYSSTHPVKRTFYAPVYKVDLVTVEKPKRPKPVKTRAAVKKKPAGKTVVKKTAKKKRAVPAKKRKIGGRKKAKAVKKAAAAPVAAADPAAAVASLRKKHEAELAVERIRETVEEEPEPVPVEEPAALPVKKGVKKVSTRDMDRALRAYYDLLWEKIRRAWVLPGAGGFEGLETIVSVVIGRSGELLKVYVEEGSGNGFYDQSALRAVRKSAPFPPLPEGYEGGMEVGFRFRQ